MTGPPGDRPDTLRFALTDTPDEARRAEIARGLSEFNHAQSPALFAESQNSRPLDVYILDAAGRTSGEVLVDVPGGRLTVRIDPETTVLTGPALIVASGVLTRAWLGA